MKRKLKILSSLFLMLFVSNIQAQDFETGYLKMFSTKHELGDVMIINQGQTKRLIGNISVVSKENAQGHVTAYDNDYIYEVISDDLEELRSNNEVKFRSDTLFIQADTVRIERQSKVLPDDKVRYSINISIARNGEWESFSVSTMDNKKVNMDEILKEVKDSGNNNWIVYADLGFSYGYTGWSTSNSSLFSTPSDNYSTKWSNKWDIMLNFNFKVNSIPVWPSIGVGFQSNVFRFDEPLTDIFTGVTPQGSISDEKFSLCANYITFPIMINYHPFKHFTLHAGAVCGVNVRNSSTGYRYSYKVNGEKVEQSTGTSFKDFNSFKWDAFLGVEVYGWTLYVTHALTPIFKDSYKYNKDLYPFAFGVMLGI